MESKINILFSCSTVGLSHIKRNLLLIEEFHNNPNYSIDILLSKNLNDHESLKKYNVLPESIELKSNGQIHDEVLSNAKTGDWDLTEFIRLDSKFHKHDCEITNKVLKRKKYHFVIADEAFWFLTGLSMDWIEKDFTFIYSSEFIGMINMKPDPKIDNYYRIKNFEFLMSTKKMDHFIYYGKILDIPDIPFGRNLPNQREWAIKNCIFASPELPQKTKSDKNDLHLELSVPSDKKVYLLIAYSSSNEFNKKLYSLALECFLLINKTSVNNHFIFYTFNEFVTGLPSNFQHVKPSSHLYKYMQISDFVISQAGILKLLELLELKKNSIIIPHDYHFEQEYWMKRRILYTTGIEHCLLRELTPESLYETIVKLEKDEVSDPFYEMDRNKGNIIKDIIYSKSTIYNPINID